MSKRDIFSELKETTFSGFLDIVAYWKQRKLILSSPELVFNDPNEKLRISPLQFAIRGLVLLSVFVFLVTWGIKTFSELPPTPLERTISKVESLELEVKSQQKNRTSEFFARNIRSSSELKLVKKVQAFSETILTLFVPLGLTLTAYFFYRLLLKHQEYAPKVTMADRAYLYWVTARLFFPNLVFVTGVEAIGFAARYGAVEQWLQGVLTNWFSFFCILWGLIVLRRAAPKLGEILGLVEFLGEKKSLKVTTNNLVASAFAANLILQSAALAIIWGYVKILKING